MHDKKTIDSEKGLECIRFNLRATLIANVILQSLFIVTFCALRPSALIFITSFITVLLYWSLALLAHIRREYLTALERIALRVGFGFLLPLAALLASYIINY